ncbi:MAG: flagellar FliJ family protein [Terracidiphilus sp.]|nr:flagellar FliJ family protein [Terracidiphilus sp.]
MPRFLPRLLRILELEEEQRQSALESAVGELHRLQSALTATVASQKRGRRLIASSVQVGSCEDRLAGIEMTRSAADLEQKLHPRIAGAEDDVTRAREVFLAKRVERRQVEALLESAQAEYDLEIRRRSQAALDEWYLSRDQGREANRRLQRKNPSRSPRPSNPELEAEE